MPSQVDITLHIRNNRNYPQEMNILGNPYNLLDTANAKTEYRYSVSALVFTNENTVSLQYRAKGATNYISFVQNLGAANIQAVVTALNLLGIGYFNYFVELGLEYIATNNDNYEFGNLNIYNPASPPLPIPPYVSYTTLSYGTTGGISIDVNGSNVVNIPNPSSNTNVDLGSLSDGDLIDINGLAGEDDTYSVYVLNVTTSTYLYSVNIGATNPFSFSFNVQNDNVYVIYYGGIY